MNPTSPAAITHLYRRAGFGATPAQIDAGLTAGYEATVERLLARDGPDDADAVRLPDLTPLYFGPSPTAQQRLQINQRANQQIRELMLWWLDRMATSSSPFREKLTWYWHKHYATSYDKVGSPYLMYQQNQLFRTKGAGDYETLTQAVAKDPAMMVWLDSNSNRRGRPNENFSRELMELFTIGIGNYSDDDVREGARSFTGWVVDREAGSIQLIRDRADYDQKALLGVTGVLRAEDVVQLLVGRDKAASHLTKRVWSHFAWPVAEDHPVVAELAPAFMSDHTITNLFRRVFTHPSFAAPEARTGLVKEPVEWVVGIMRALGLPAARLQSLNPSLLTTLNLLGQQPFYPPSVAGWPQNTYWLSSQTSLARLRFAQAVANAADLGWLERVAAAERPAALARQLGAGNWSAVTATALSAARSPKSLLVLGLTSPEFVLN